MEQSDSISKVRWLPCSLYMISFLRVVFDEYGINCDSGFILVADDSYQERMFREGYVKSTSGNGMKISLANYKKQFFYNYNLGIALLTASVKEKVDTFLEAEDFFPVLVSGGILPQEFREGYYVFRIRKADIDYLNDGEFAKHIEILKRFIINNIDSICQSLKLIDSCEDMVYVKHVKYPNLFKAFLAVSEVYRLFYRELVGEAYESSFRRSFVKCTLHNIQKISDFADGMDIPNMLTETVFRCVDVGKLKIVCQVDELDRNYHRLFETGEAVFYDEEFYYFSEAGFRVICTPLLEQMSWLELKQLMSDNGMIERLESGFTTKKTFVIDGEPERLRVIKVRRECLINENIGELLEDYVYCKEEVSNE